jgi:hypothetical protein
MGAPHRGQAPSALWISDYAETDSVHPEVRATGVEQRMAFGSTDIDEIELAAVRQHASRVAIEVGAISCIVYAGYNPVK